MQLPHMAKFLIFEAGNFFPKSIQIIKDSFIWNGSSYLLEHKPHVENDIFTHLVFYEVLCDNQGGNDSLLSCICTQL